VPRAWNGAALRLQRARGARAVSFMSYVFLHPIFLLIYYLLELATFVVIAAVIVSWLIAFGVLNMSNPAARQVVRTLDALTEPLFRQVRRVIPPVGGLDLSPIFILIAIYILQVFVEDLYGYLLQS
jgi:YggT family protein